MGTGSLGLRKELSSLAAIRHTRDTTLTARVGRCVCGSKEKTSFTVWGIRKTKQHLVEAFYVGSLLIHCYYTISKVNIGTGN